MTVPKAAVNKYYRTEAGKNDIGLSRQVMGMEAEPETLAMQQAADQDFRLCVAPAYAGHHPAARRAVDYVDH